MPDTYLPRKLEEIAPGAVSARFGMVLQDFARCCGAFILHSLPGSSMHGYATNELSPRDQRLRKEIVEYLSGGALSILIEENPIEGIMKPQGPVNVLAIAIEGYGNVPLFEEAGWTLVSKNPNGVWSKGGQLNVFHKLIPLPTEEERVRWGKK